MPRQGWVRIVGSSSLAVLAVLFCTSLPTRALTQGADSTAAVIEVKLPPDILYRDHVSPDSAVVFRHSTHFDLAGRKCTGCHPRPFLMLSPTHRTGHLEMDAGGSCGVCHDGKHAFGVRDPSSCLSCHSGRSAGREALASGASKRQSGVPGPIVYARSQASPGPVTFRHGSHLRGGGSCASCHPQTFAMKALAVPAAAMHERAACGRCHNGTTEFGVEDAEQCARCHVPAKGTP
jgi:c(7)-type cytochrome triheme protein